MVMSGNKTSNIHKHAHRHNNMIRTTLNGNLTFHQTTVLLTKIFISQQCGYRNQNKSNGLQMTLTFTAVTELWHR